MSVSTTALGSSPLTRGKLPNSILHTTRLRLIPAHAGKTDRRWKVACRGAAHPRSRGENAVQSACAPALMGSSPLTRGKRGDLVEHLFHDRLIPAHAGKTSPHQEVMLVGAAHPRSRGENRAAVVSVVIRTGSSPLTRGKQFGGHGGLCRAGLIPAHAGKTGRVRSRLAGRSAHPRSRGENSIPFITRIMDGGSSPLTRGKQQCPKRRTRDSRLIPAHAGKTS